jgi:hypothetical protein
VPVPPFSSPGKRSSTALLVFHKPHSALPAEALGCLTSEGMTNPYPQTYYPAPPWTPAPGPTPDSSSAGIATAGLMVSVLSLTVAPFPFVGLPAWAMGLSLSIVALTRLRRGRPGRAPAFVGLGIAILSSGLSLFMSVMVFFTLINKHDPDCSQPQPIGSRAASVCGQFS